MNRPKDKRLPNRFVFIFVLVLCSFSKADSFARSDSDSLRILFVGNSYTYYNSMPQMVRAMGEHAFPGRTIETKFTGRGGATLKQLWESGDALKLIEAGRWNYVVLQEQSMLGTAVVEDGKRYIGSPEPFFTYARRFARAITGHGGKPVFLMTWSREDRPEQQKYLTYAYMSIARELGAGVAPVGMAWDRLRPVAGLDLYQKDGSHPSVRGSYLVAAMLFAVIFEIRPDGIPGRLRGREILPGGRLSARDTLLCDLPEKEARIIQDAVAALFDNMMDHNGYLEVERAVSGKKPSILSYIAGVLATAQGQAVVLVLVAMLFLVVRVGRKLYSKQLPKADT